MNLATMHADRVELKLLGSSHARMSPHLRMLFVNSSSPSGTAPNFSSYHAGERHLHTPPNLPGQDKNLDTGSPLLK